MRKERGFTLIELLIVLAILGILVGIVAMSIGGLTESAEKRGLSSEAETVQTAMDTFSTQDVVVDDLDPIDPQSTFTQITTTSTLTDTFAKYLKRDTKYQYKWEAKGEVLTATNQDGLTYTIPGGWVE